MLLDVPGTWKSISLKVSHQNFPLDLHPYHDFIRRATVKHIKISGSENNIGLSIDLPIYQLLSHYLLAINDNIVTIDVEGLTSRNALKFINMCGNTLTRAFIEIETYHHFRAKMSAANVTAGVFIRHYPNIKQFAFIGPIENPREYESASLTDIKHQHLIDMYLSVTLANVLHTGLVPLFHHTIRELNLTGYTGLYDPNMMDVLSHYRFPSLRHLALGWSVDGRDVMLDHLFKNIVGTLTSLTTINPEPYYLDDDLLMIITRFAQRLEKFELESGRLITPDGLKRLLKIMTRLR
ncbi:hypothetical protein BDA99DRAFT_574002 [Phascolomyces articulosus]|uniref:Uncharacterized protein n=1 Tax=Phascolomyces articulosus TaxID=60185 RepID=A0AAD5JV76_9FUNG|nr:hypothetical protein BDA99DRAFT_574002 [Phascolomyces articulosus]